MFWGGERKKRWSGGRGYFTVDRHSPMNSFMEAVDLIKVSKDGNQQTRFDGLRVIDSYGIFHREYETFYLGRG